MQATYISLSEFLSIIEVYSLTFMTQEKIHFWDTQKNIHFWEFVDFWDAPRGDFPSFRLGECFRFSVLPSMKAWDFPSCRRWRFDISVLIFRLAVLPVVKVWNIFSGPAFAGTRRTEKFPTSISHKKNFRLPPPILKTQVST